MHGAVQVHVDDIAERVTALGGTAEGTAAAAGSTPPPWPVDVPGGAGHVEAVSMSLACFGRAVREAVAEAGEIGDADTKDLFTGVSRDIDKNPWLVEAHAGT